MYIVYKDTNNMIMINIICIRGFWDQVSLLLKLYKELKPYKDYIIRYDFINMFKGQIYVYIRICKQIDRWMDRF